MLRMDCIRHLGACGNTTPCELASVVPFSNMCWVTSYFLLFHLYFRGEISSWVWSSHVQHQVARTTAGPAATAALAAAVAAAAAARAAEPLCLWPSMGNMINQINQSVLEVSRHWKTKLYRAWQLSNKQITGTIETWIHCFYTKCRLFRYRLSLLGSTAWIMVTSIGLQWPQAFVIPELVEARILWVWVKIHGSYFFEVLSWFTIVFPEGTCFLAGFPSCSNLVALGTSLFLKGTTARGDQSSNSRNGRNVIRPLPRNRSKRLSWCTAEGIACPDDRKLMCIPLRWRYQVNQSPWGTNPSRDLLHIFKLHIHIYI